MPTLFVMAVFAAIAQIQYSPPEILPRVLQMSDGEVLHAFIEEEDWRRRGQVIVRLDDPLRLSKPTKTITVGNVERDYLEPIHEWRTRHEKAWRDAGYINLGTRDAYFYVAKTEYDLARRANAMARGDEVAVVSNSPEPNVPPQSEPPSAAGPGFLVLWGRHLAVIAIALVASSTAVWYFGYRTG